MNNYYKNFILCGELDYHCLLCQESFQNKESVDKHIKWEKHRKSLKKQEYVGAYKKECIYKVKECYYCEICNEVPTNVIKHKELATHVDKKKSPENIAEKKSLVITRNTDNTFTINNDLKISLLAWHGVKNNYCTLCKGSWPDGTSHISLNVHIVNLIACETKSFQEYYYRKITDDKLYCFLCCKVFPNTSLETHWSVDCDVTFKAKVVLNESDRKLIKNDPELANALFSIQKLFFNIDTANNKSECLECKKTVKATLEDMLKHRNKHISKDDSESTNESYEVKFTEVVDHGRRRQEVATYGKENYLKLNEGGSWTYCTLCDVSLSAHMKQCIDHVQGLRHRGFLELIGVRKIKRHEEPSYAREKMTAYLPNVFRVDFNSMYYVKDHIPVTDLCFMYMKGIGKKAKKVKCYACDVVVDLAAAPEHYKTKAHKDKILASYVLQSHEGMEFVRMIRPNLYHCGICNTALPFWESAKRHFMTSPHISNKTKMLLHCEEVRDLKEKYDICRKTVNITLQMKRLGLY